VVEVGPVVHYGNQIAIEGEGFVAYPWLPVGKGNHLAQSLEEYPLSGSKNHYIVFGVEGTNVYSLYSFWRRRNHCLFPGTNCHGRLVKDLKIILLNDLASFQQGI
jgi:hypothetical protein